MSRPGIEVVVGDAIPAGGAQTATDTLFTIGETERGPVDDTVLVRSLGDFVDRFGDRLTAAPQLYDQADAYFRDNGARAYVRRLQAGATAATIAVLDPDDDPLFTVTALEPGTWGNALRLDLVTPVTAAAMFARARPRLTLVEASEASEAPTVEMPTTAPARGRGRDTAAAPAPAQVPAVAVISHGTRALERSQTLATVGDLAAWSQGSRYVRVTADGAPTSALTLGGHQLATGAAGTVPVTDPTALLDTALAIDRALGPGQLTAPGKHTAPQHEALLRAAEAGNRCAILDPNPTLDESGLAAHVTTLRTLDVDRYGGLFAPRVTLPGPAAGTTRTVTFSGTQAGLIARQDATGGPGQPAAGSFGISRYAQGLDVEYEDDARERLMLAGVNTARIVYGRVRAYGFRSLVDPAGPRRAWKALNHVRLGMAIKAEGEEIAERYVYKVIDGRKRMIGQFAGELGGMCLRYYQQDLLYGETPEDAFRIETGDSVNTPDTIANGELHAVLLVKMSEGAEFVRIEIVKQPITEPLA